CGKDLLPRTSGVLRRPHLRDDGGRGGGLVARDQAPDSRLQAPVCPDLRMRTGGEAQCLVPAAGLARARPAPATGPAPACAAAVALDPALGPGALRCLAA